MFNESDESVVSRWVENPYWQYFTGEEYFQHEQPSPKASSNAKGIPLGRSPVDLRGGLALGKAFLRKSLFARLFSSLNDLQTTTGPTTFFLDFFINKKNHALAWHFH